MLMAALILRGFGLSKFRTILYNMIPGGISIVSNIVAALIIMKIKYKSPVLFVVSLFPLAGAAGLWTLPHDESHKRSLLAVYFILNVYQCITPIVFSWCFANTAGHTKKTVMTGVMYVGLTVGNVSGYLFQILTSRSSVPSSTKPIKHQSTLKDWKPTSYALPFSLA